MRQPATSPTKTKTRKTRTDVGPRILAADHFGTNARLIERLHQLGYVTDDDLVLDATYGRGRWWSIYRPENLVTNDLDRKYNTDYHYDVRRLPSRWTDVFNVVAFDPPYVSIGGRHTSTIKDYHNRYGSLSAMRTPMDLHMRLILPGMTNCVRAIRPGALILQKCANYVSSGTFQPAAHWAYDAGISMGLKLVAEFVFVSKTSRPQPEGRGPQKHARHNYSLLYIWQKPWKPANSLR